MVDKADNQNTQAADDKSNESSSTLEAAIAAKQAAILAKSVEPEKGDEKPDEDSKPVLEPLDDDEPIEPVDDDDSGDEGGDEDTTILPAGHRRAALARGWKEEEINHFLETKPEEALVAFRDTFDKWQQESSEWSARGRALMAAGTSVGDKKDDDKSDPSLTKFDADVLIAEHGNEELINALVKPLNQMVDQINSAVGRLSQSEEETADSRAAALAIEAQNFLTSGAMKPYEEVYGIEVKDLTANQLENRFQLFEEADIIAAGARAHEQKITVSEALTRAHAIISQETRDEGIRAEIRKSLKKRTKTSRGSRQRSAPADKKDEPVSEKELIKRTEARLKALREK